MTRDGAHPSPETIHDLVDGALDPAAEVELRRHLAECDGCRAEERAVLDLKAGLADLPEADPNRGDYAALAARLRRRRFARRGAALSALAASAVLALSLLGRPEPSDPPLAARSRPPVAAGLEVALGAARLDFEARRAELDAETVLLIEANLAIIDRAIANTARLAGGDADRERTRQLETKLQLLTLAAGLPRERDADAAPPVDPRSSP